MPGSDTKTVTLYDKRTPAQPSVDQFRALTVAAWSRWRNAAQAQDTIPGSGARIVARVTRKGSSDAGVPDDPTHGTGTQDAPSWGTWRTIALPRIRLTPGSYLGASILYLPSGMTQFFDLGTGGTWEQDGSRARMRVSVDFALGGYSNTSNTFVHHLDGSPLDNGNAPSPPQPHLLRAKIPAIVPDDLLGDLAVGQQLSEWCHADITIEIDGGFRGVDLILYEHPWYHAQDDAAADQSAHAYIVGGGIPEQPQTDGPQTRRDDGATYTERRFGSDKLEEVARRQTEYMGPVIFEWSAYDPDESDVTSTALPYVFTTSTSLVDLLDSGHTSWNANHPGWTVDGGAHHLPWNLNDETYADGSGIGLVPVTVEAYVHVSATGTGTLRVQSSDFEWVELTFTNTSPGWVAMHGYLACQSVGDQASRGNAMILVHSNSVSVEARVGQVVVYYGHHESGG